MLQSPSQFSKKCSESWKTMSAKEKGKFEDMAKADKARYEREMKTYIPPKAEKGVVKAEKSKKKEEEENEEDEENEQEEEDEEDEEQDEEDEEEEEDGNE
ncbi:High mobility group protein B1 [Tupaia chinensis]|uniref:High mobility group protein B1 n=1 Tax=Tupaia chinensis TaxID=246437 RepID=L9JCP7_TUPCH|nr:High mobility group protein B1 [Tupaia chinensis]